MSTRRSALPRCRSSRQSSTGADAPPPRSRARLGDIAGVDNAQCADGTVHSYQSYVVQLADDIDRDAVIRAMRTRDVETTLGTYGMHLQPYFRERFGIPDAELPQTTRAHHQALTLPLYPQLTDDDLDVIAAALRASVAESPRGAA